VMQGRGLLKRSDGTEFMGTFEANVLQEGTLTYPDGSKLIGTFKNGKPFSATFTHIDGQTILWKNGVESTEGLNE